MTRVIDQADDQNQLDPHARLEKQTLASLPEADIKLPAEPAKNAARVAYGSPLRSRAYVELTGIDFTEACSPCVVAKTRVAVEIHLSAGGYFQRDFRTTFCRLCDASVLTDREALNEVPTSYLVCSG
ncbi:MAG: hypothetical protein ACRED4_06890 [Brevundimonas sp.]